MNLDTHGICILFYSLKSDGCGENVLARGGTCYHQNMGRPGSGMTRRTWLVSAAIAGRLRAEGRKGEVFPSDAGRYPDPLTELEVFRLTKPEYASTLTAYYNRGI